MNEANNPPPPPKESLPVEKRKAIEEQPTDSQIKELPDASGDTAQKQPSKDSTKETTPQIKADASIPNTNKEPTLGTSDLKKP